LIEHWVDFQLQETVQAVKSAAFKYSQVIERIQDVHQTSSLEVLRRAHVVGMTTAGVASAQGMLAALGPKVSSAHLLYYFIKQQYYNNTINVFSGAKLLNSG
jgi:hypothetical protein